MKTIIKVGNITLAKYSNGSYSYEQENPVASRNIPTELARKIINERTNILELEAERFSHDVSDFVDIQMRLEKFNKEKKKQNLNLI